MAVVGTVRPLRTVYTALPRTVSLIGTVGPLGTIHITLSGTG